MKTMPARAPTPRANFESPGRVDCIMAADSEFYWRKLYPYQPAALNQLPRHQFCFCIGIEHRCRNNSRQSECSVHCQHRKQQFPGGSIDARPDDARIDEVLELVHDDEK